MSLDLRNETCDEVLARVQAALDTKFDLTTEVRKRRSVGFRTDRSTWVRIEIRCLSRIDGEGWNGAERASVLCGVARPTWY